MPGAHPSESPAKKQSKWSADEDALIIDLRGSNMKWEDISKRLPGRSAISCRLHYQNYLERKSEWDEERKNKLARLYERFKPEMWSKVAEEMQVPWRAAEAMHWQLGENGMAHRAGVVPFSLSATTPNEPPHSHPHSDLHPHAPFQLQHHHLPNLHPPPPRHRHSPSRSGHSHSMSTSSISSIGGLGPIPAAGPPPPPLGVSMSVIPPPLPRYGRGSNSHFSPPINIAGNAHLPPHPLQHPPYLPPSSRPISSGPTIGISSPPPSSQPPHGNIGSSSATPRTMQPSPLYSVAKVEIPHTAASAGGGGPGPGRTLLPSLTEMTTGVGPYGGVAAYSSGDGAGYVPRPDEGRSGGRGGGRGERQKEGGKRRASPDDGQRERERQRDQRERERGGPMVIAGVGAGVVGGSKRR